MNRPPGADTPPVLHAGYFTARLRASDPAIAEALADEGRRQRDVVELIASENIVSRAVLEVQGSLLTNKTIEGLPGNRYHGGAVNVDIIERIAIERACRDEDFRPKPSPLCEYCNWQAYCPAFGGDPARAVEVLGQPTLV